MLAVDRVLAGRYWMKRVTFGLDLTSHPPCWRSPWSRRPQETCFFRMQDRESLSVLGTFDGCISISVLQWLCNADKASHHPKARLTRFFSTLYSALRRGARAIFQFYPENDDQVQLIMGCAVRCGFEGGLVVDYPNSKKAKKFYLCLFAGQEISGVRQHLPAALGEGEEGEPDEHSVQYTSKKRSDSRARSSKRKPLKDKNWVLKKKEQLRAKGDKTAKDSKFTARKRRPKF